MYADWGNRPLRVKVTTGTSIGACAITWSWFVRITGWVDGVTAGRIFLFFVKTLPLAALCAVEPDEICVSGLLAKDSAYRRFKTD